MAGKITKDIVSQNDEEQLMYIGDTLPNGLISGTVYIGIPKHIKDMFIKQPQLEKLFVSLEKIVEAQRQIDIEGSPLFIANKIVKEAYNGNNI